MYSASSNGLCTGVTRSNWACRNHVVTKDWPLRIQWERKVLGSNICFLYLWKVSIVNGFSWYFPAVMSAGQLWESWPRISHQSSWQDHSIIWIFSARPPNHAAAAFCRNTPRQISSLRVSHPPATKQSSQHQSMSGYFALRLSDPMCPQYIEAPWNGPPLHVPLPLSSIVAVERHVGFDSLWYVSRSLPGLWEPNCPETILPTNRSLHLSKLAL